MTLRVERTTPEQFRCKTTWCKLYNHWINPFGNWLEPLPFPQKYAYQAKKSFIPPMLWWTLRNPVHNFMHHIIGIVPVGKRYEWINPTEAGWERKKCGNWSLWTKRMRMPLPYYSREGKSVTFYCGWTSRGNFGFALRKSKNIS